MKKVLCCNSNLQIDKKHLNICLVNVQVHCCVLAVMFHIKVFGEVGLKGR